MRKFNRKKWRDLTLLGILSIFVIGSHQNCAPVNPQSYNNASAPQENAGPAGVIDSVKKDAAVSFAAKELQLNSQLREVSLQGVCSEDQQDAVLGWEVRKDDVDAEVFATGFAKCDGGKFSVELAPTQLLECGKAYRVRARLGYGEAGESIITRVCPSES